VARAGPKNRVGACFFCDFRLKLSTPRRRPSLSGFNCWVNDPYSSRFHRFRLKNVHASFWPDSRLYIIDGDFWIIMKTISKRWNPTPSSSFSSTAALLIWVGEHDLHLSVTLSAILAVARTRGRKRMGNRESATWWIASLFRLLFLISKGKKHA